jgi:hypothetical protein
LVIWPFDKTLFRKVNYYLGYASWCREYTSCSRTGSFMLWFAVFIKGIIILPHKQIMGKMCSKFYRIHLVGLTCSKFQVSVCN